MKMGDRGKSTWLNHEYYIFFNYQYHGLILLIIIMVVQKFAVPIELSLNNSDLTLSLFFRLLRDIMKSCTKRKLLTSELFYHPQLKTLVSNPLSFFADPDSGWKKSSFLEAYSDFGLQIIRFSGFSDCSLRILSLYFWRSYMKKKD